MKDSKDYFYSTVDQPELVNNPKILDNGFLKPELKDGRGLPKKKEEYQSLLESLFLATDRCYFIEGEPYKIRKEDGDNIIFEPTGIGQIITINRNEIDILKTKEFCKDNCTSPSLYMPYFGSGEWGDLIHKLEIGQISIFDQESKKIILKRYDRIFSNLKQSKYPSDQRAINSLFYLSVLLDFDKDKQKNLAKYFINNALNTLYREEDNHYGISKFYKGQDIRKKIGLSIKGFSDKDDEFWKDKHKYLSVEDCKKIADRANISPEEFSGILYDVCLFKLGDDNSASASFHRKTNFQLEDIKLHLIQPHKEDIEDIQYIYKEGKDYHSGIFYGVEPYNLLKANEGLGVNFSEQKNEIENNKKTSIQIRQEKIKELGETFYNKYKEHKLDIDFESKTESVFLATEGDSLVITDKSEGRNILGKLHIGIYKTSPDKYDHENNKQMYSWARKYEINIYNFSEIKVERVYSIIKMFEEDDKTKLELRSLKVGK